MSDPEAICGNCAHFDLRKTRGEPIGTVKLLLPGTDSATEFNLGFCRAGLGLMFGALIEFASCKQERGIFQPRSDGNEAQPQATVFDSA